MKHHKTILNTVRVILVLVMERMSELTRDGTGRPRACLARLNSQARAGTRKYPFFPCSADHEQDWQTVPVEAQSSVTVICVCVRVCFVGVGVCIY